VLATGGSIPRSSATYGRLLQTCRTVWLRASVEEHEARVRAQGDLRPSAGRPRAREELAALLAERESEYARCELVVDTSRRTADAIAAELAQRFGA
jgi:XRE family aerobic/anaerobic benzoate catabolism transcriptional regulator